MGDWGSKKHFHLIEVLGLVVQLDDSSQISDANLSRTARGHISHSDELVEHFFL